MYSTASLIIYNVKTDVRWIKIFHFLFFEDLSILGCLYSTKNKNPKNIYIKHTAHKKMTRPKNIFQGDLRGIICV